MNKICIRIAHTRHPNLSIRIKSLLNTEDSSNGFSEFCNLDMEDLREMKGWISGDKRVCSGGGEWERGFVSVELEVEVGAGREVGWLGPGW